MGVGWHQPDPGFWAVRALQALGLVWEVKTVAHLALRPGARRVPAARGRSFHRVPEAGMMGP
jgi:stearoyl-CoA desaturase (delta-9 desaturase)